MRIKSIAACTHDSSYGGVPFKVVVQVEIDVKEFNKLCPVVGKSRNTLCGRVAAPRDLGNLVMQVNDAVYSINSNIPAYNPSIDSSGHKRAVNGVKTLEFVYFLKDEERARALGFEYHKGHFESVPRHNQRINLMREVA